MPPETDVASLGAAVVAASTPRDAAAALSSVSDFLSRHAGDHPRAFFADVLPSLLFRLFVASSPSPVSPSFLDLAAGDAALADIIASLLAPSGPLLVAVSAADRYSLVRFMFPRERLPDWLAFALSSPHVSSAEVLSPLIAGRVDSKLHLSVFEYYLFWFAYYPISAANAKTTAVGGAPKALPSTSKPPLNSRSRLESWASTLASTAGRNSHPKPKTSLYLKLLYAYLKKFVPNDCSPPHGGGGTLLHRTVVGGVNTAESYRRAEFFVHTLIQFWLVGDDFSPLPVKTCRAYGLPLLSLLSRANAAFSESPPAPGLGDAVKLLVMYLNRHSVVEAQNVFEGMFSRERSCDYPTGHWNQLLQRPLYRFLLRTFLFCSMDADIKNIAEVFSAWMVYMEPWKVQQEDLDQYDLAPPGGQNVQRVGDGKWQECDAAYSPAWQSFVMSNYLFYSSLVVHFLGFAHKSIHSNVSSVLRMVSEVLKVLGTSKLLELIYDVDTAYHSRFSDPLSCYLDVPKYVPLIREQLQDWEDGLSEHESDGSFLHIRRNSDLRLFSNDDDGAYNLLQLLLLRAESEIQRLPGDTSQTLYTLDVIRSNMKKVFYKHVQSSQAKTLAEGEHNQHHGRVEVFTPKHPRLTKNSSADVKYRGDWMMRPISDSEVAWLARKLILFSAWLNKTLQLDLADADAVPKGHIIIKFDQNDLNRVGGPKDVARMALIGVLTLLMTVGKWVLQFMRTHRIKINLRSLASKKLIAAAVLFAVFTVMKKVLL